MSYYLAPSLILLRGEVNSLWPNRSKLSDGWIGDPSHQARVSDHNPDYSAGGVVRALDITANGIDVDRVLAHTTNDSRVSYVIHNHQIYTHARGWYAYNGSNPHTTHIHVSIAHTTAAERDTKPWISSTSTATTPSTGGLTMSDINTILNRLEAIDDRLREHDGNDNQRATRTQNAILDRLPKLVWLYKGTNETVDAYGYLRNTRREVARVLGAIDGVLETMSDLDGVDYDTVAQRVEAGVSAALSNLAADVSLNIDTGETE